MQGQTVILSTARQRRIAHELVDKAPEGAVLNIKERKRTDSQNDKMWAMLSDVSRAKPRGLRHTPEVWKCIFMHALGHSVRFEAGLNGEPFPVGFRSSRLTVGQMSDLIEFIYAWCADYDVQWSDEASIRPDHRVEAA